MMFPRFPVLPFPVPRFQRPRADDDRNDRVLLRVVMCRLRYSGTDVCLRFIFSLKLCRHSCVL